MDKTLSNYGAKLWNALPNELKDCKDLVTFRERVKNWNEPLCKCSICVHSVYKVKMRLKVHNCFIFFFHTIIILFTYNYSLLYLKMKYNFILYYIILYYTLHYPVLN